jgi:hypothetical protein
MTLKGMSLRGLKTHCNLLLYAKLMRSLYYLLTVMAVLWILVSIRLAGVTQSYELHALAVNLKAGIFSHSFAD